MTAEVVLRGRTALRRWYRYQAVPRMPGTLAHGLDAFRKRSLPVRVLVTERLLRTRYRTSPLPGPDLARVAERNLEMVVSVLEDIGVGYFLVENNTPHATAVAVSETDRARVLSAMDKRWSGQPVYVGLARRDCLSFDHPLPSRRALRLPAARRVGALLVFRAYSTGSLTVGADLACTVEFWTKDHSLGLMRAPRGNRVSTVLPVDAGSRPVSVGGRTYRGIEPFSVVTPPEIDFPIDVVYTWVDGSDPAWAARRDHYLGATVGELNQRAVDAARYTSRDELRYSMRSIEMFAPWVRRIFVVTGDQAPPWLDASHPRVQVVSHRDIFTDPTGTLPTFNSHAIESQLHHIQGLAEHYLYFNDDMLLGRPVEPTTFFVGNGLARMFLSPAKVDYGPPSVADAPVTSAAKNTRQIIVRDFGRYLTNKQKHAPYPHRRSVLYEMEEKYAEEFARTAASRFRHPTDVSVASSFQQYYGFMTGRTVPSLIAYTYVDLADPLASAKLRRIRDRRDFDAYCINDTDADAVDADAQIRSVRSFFESFYPLPATWERM